MLGQKSTAGKIRVRCYHRDSELRCSPENREWKRKVVLVSSLCCSQAGGGGQGGAVVTEGSPRGRAGQQLLDRNIP